MAKWWQSEYYYADNLSWPTVLRLFPEWFAEWTNQYPIYNFTRTENLVEKIYFRFGFDETKPFDTAEGATTNTRADGLSKGRTRLSDEHFIFDRLDLAEGKREELFFQFYR